MGWHAIVLPQDLGHWSKMIISPRTACSTQKILGSLGCTVKLFHNKTKLRQKHKYTFGLRHFSSSIPKAQHFPPSLLLRHYFIIGFSVCFVLNWKLHQAWSTVVYVLGSDIKRSGTMRGETLVQSVKSHVWIMQHAVQIRGNSTFR